MVKYVCDLFLYKGVKTNMNNMSNKSLVSSGMVLTTSSGSVYTITDRVAKNGRKYQLISGGNLEQDNLVIFPVRGAMIGQPFQCHFMNVESNGAYANQTLTTSRIASARAVRPTNGLSMARPMEQVDMKQPRPRFKGADVAYSQPQMSPRPVKSVPEMIAERPNYNQGAMRATQDILSQKSAMALLQANRSEDMVKRAHGELGIPKFSYGKECVIKTKDNDIYHFHENWDSQNRSYFECRSNKFPGSVLYVESFDTDSIKPGKSLKINCLDVPANNEYHRGCSIKTSKISACEVEDNIYSEQSPVDNYSPSNSNNDMYQNVSPYMAPEVAMAVLAGDPGHYDSVVHPQPVVQETSRPKCQPVPPERREHMRLDNRPSADTICANINRIYGQDNANQRIRKEDNRGVAFPGYNPADFPNQEIENTAMQQVVTVNTQNDTYSFRENWDKNGMSYFECRCRKFGDNVHYVQSFNPDKIACGEPLVIRFLNVPENAGYHGRGILTTPVRSMNVKSVPRQFFDSRTLPSIDTSEEEMDRFDEMNHYNGL